MKFDLKLNPTRYVTTALSSASLAFGLYHFPGR